MDRERLKLSSEILGRSARRAARQQERKDKRTTRLNERKTRRITPYHELARRNRVVFEKAKLIAEAGQEIDIEDNIATSNLVVLGLTRDTKGTPSRKNIVVKVENNPHSYRKDEFHGLTFSGDAAFTFLAVSDKDLKKIQKNPTAFKVNPQGWADNADEIARESTYKTESGYEPLDELMKRGVEHSPNRVLNPIGAIDRALETRKISSRMNDLESTISMVEEAVNNPQLNPVLAAALGAKTQNQQANGF